MNLTSYEEVMAIRSFRKFKTDFRKIQNSKFEVKQARRENSRPAPQVDWAVDPPPPQVDWGVDLGVDLVSRLGF